MRPTQARPQALGYFVAVPLALLAVVLAIPLAQRHGIAFAWRQVPVALLYLALFVLAQSIVLRFEVRRHSLNVTVGEIPLLLALFYLSPLLVVIVRPLALLVVQGWQRAPTVKFIFNVASTALATTVAAWIVAAAPPHGVGPSTWLVLAVAVVAAVVISLIAVVGVISLVQGAQPWSMWTRTATSVLIVVAVNVTVALVVLRALQGEPWSVLLLVGICVVLFYVYRAYAAFRRQRRSLAELYELTRALADAGRGETLADVMLSRVRELLWAEHATLWLAPQGRYPEQVLTARVDAPGLLDTSVTPPELRATVVTRQSPLLVGPRQCVPAGAAELRPLVRQAGVDDAIVVPLRSGSAVIGTLEVCGKLGDLSWFGEQDLRLLETLAAHAAVAVENARLVDRLYHDAYHDSLTGLPNRRRVLAQLAEAVRVEAPGEVVAVIGFDIDGLRDVNESLGHDTGDELVREVAARIRRLAPAAALVGHGGSDEFVITVRLPGLDEAIELASTVRAALREPMVGASGATVDVDVAVGIALYPEHADSAEELLKAADLAARRAKQLATPLQVFDPALRAQSTRRLALAADLRRALEAGELAVWFQPKVALLDRRVVGVECLARWEHPAHGPVPPTDFVAVAEHTGQLARLSEVVLRQGLRRARGWLDAGTPLPVAVNLSTQELLDPALPGRLAGLLAESGVPARLLTLEITEDGMVREPDRCLVTLNRLHELGVRLAIDDFGTGYSSLSYLRRLPVDEVKIDRSFVQGMVSDQGDLKIVSAVVDLARHFNLTVVAEGVESERTVSLLEGLACDVGQGFLFSRALPFERFQAWLATQTEPVVAGADVAGADVAGADVAGAGLAGAGGRRLRADLGA